MLSKLISVYAKRFDPKFVVQFWHNAEQYYFKKFKIIESFNKSLKYRLKFKLRKFFLNLLG